MFERFCEGDGGVAELGEEDDFGVAVVFKFFFDYFFEGGEFWVCGLFFV